MNADAPLLDVLRLPLRGSRLIEASAGTGKTFTIAALYLRLVLGHGGDEAGFTRPLTPPEILVVTFTEAATQELRERIRDRLAEAAQAFAVDPADVMERSPGEDLLHDLRAGHAPADWPRCAELLRLAAEWMDEAAVSTIHGWCHRMLSEHAFDSGSLFTQTLETDQQALQAEAVRDHWRSFFTPLPLDQAARVQAWWKSPAELLQALRPLLGQALPLQPGQPPAQALAQADEQRAAELAKLKAPWRGDGGWWMELAGLIEQAARQLKMPKRGAWLQALRDWAEGVEPLPALTDTAWRRLSPQGMAEDAPLALQQHRALQQLATLRDQVQALPDGREAILLHAAHSVRERIAQAQAQRAQMGFDELLTRLDAALQGPNGERLAGLIRQQFPVALIDEFQDTDPLQYRIFDAVYRVRANAPHTALLLIGDPKQAIYAFRGADIHTYLAARRDTAGRHATLGMNFRSSGAMVHAVNHLFGQAEQRDGPGAFLFRDADGNALPFQRVQARGLGERWQLQGHDAPALTLWTLPGEQPCSVGTAQQAMAEACATAIVQLLNDPLTGFSEAGALRRVQPGDIAVLVNDGLQAQAVRANLKSRGLRSVYLSDKDSVFNSEAAGDLQRWLAACAEPDDDRLLRAALGTTTLALSWAELDALNHDEAAWEARLLQFRGYQQVWRRQGVLPMLRHLLHDFQVPQRLLATEDERKLTDLLHLAELLQQASAELPGEHALLRHLAEQRRGQLGDEDTRRLRLESDADLVKVVTVHKSKGLEYPLVFLPFATAFKPVKADKGPVRWHDDQGQLRLSLTPDEAIVERADRERLGEDLRKLYVALTRARHATWVGCAAVDGVERSALGQLLSDGVPMDPGAWQAALQRLAQQCDAIAVMPAPPPADERARLPQATPVWAPEPPLPATPRPRWWIASYSALRTAHSEPGDDAARLHAELPAGGPDDTSPDTPASAVEAIYDDSQPVDTTVGAEGGLHAFPFGPRAGTFLHGLLEWAGRRGFARVTSDLIAAQDLADLVARRCNLAGWSRWTSLLQAWLPSWLATPLPFGDTPIALADLGSVQVEMEFWFPTERCDTRQLDTLVTQQVLPGAPRPPLSAQQLNGMFKGYIDLAFEHQGRYYVADYKSNRLGEGDAAYTPEALQAQVLQHRYELQLVLYVFALHRLLRLRLPGYDYQRHIGGAASLFLRGHAAPGRGVFALKPPAELIDALDRLFDAGGRA